MYLGQLLKYFSVNFLTRSHLSSHSYMLKSDLYYVKKGLNVLSTLGGQTVSSQRKELYTLSKLNSALMPEERNLQEQNNDCNSIFDLSHDCYDNCDEVVLHESNDIHTVIHLYEPDKNLYIHSIHEMSSSPQLNRIISLPLNYEVTLNSLVTTPSSLSFYFDVYKSSYPAVNGSSLSFTDNNISCSNNETFDKTSQEEDKPKKPSEEQLLNVKNCLCDSILNFFNKPLDFTIYHKDIIFQNNIKRLTTQGISAYMNQMYIFKLFGIFQYAKIKVDILKISHHIEDGTVRIRWRASGLSRCKLLLHFGKVRKRSLQTFFEEESEWLDGFSVFSIGTDGLIYKHVCDKMVPDNEIPNKEPSLRTKLLTLLQVPRRPSPSGVQAVLIYPVVSPSSYHFRFLEKKKNQL